MSDEALRELERRFRGTGSPESGAAWLRARLRAGTLRPERLLLAARCGDAGARDAAEGMTATREASALPLSEPAARQAVAEGLIGISGAEPRPAATAESVREALVRVQVDAARGQVFDPEGQRRLLTLALDALVGPPPSVERSCSALLARGAADPVIRWALL